jgi:xanthine dehydrogenase iron-sulfur cluster and FAD-binding subunit A
VAQVQEAGGQVVDQAHEQASRAQSFLQRQLDDNPLIVAAVAVAVGGMLAGTVRSTSREDQLLGEARDRVIEAAQEVTSATAQKVGRVVDQAQSAATDEAREALVGHPGGSS